MVCKIDHTAELAIPVILCRACNPDTRTPEQRAQAIERERARAEAEAIRASKVRELAKARRDLAATERPTSNPGIAVRKAESLKAKIHNLEQELSQ